jgi:CRP-like cAMP-binding protein
MMESFNLPFIAYVEGSYFGDSDIFFQGDDTSNGRDGTATADSEVHLLVLGKKDLNAIMEEFEEMALEMRQIARERKANHEKLIKSIVNEFKKAITDEETSPKELDFS